MPPGCATCTKHLETGAEKRCGGCRSVVYCDADCQRAGWATHKTVCKQFRASRDRAKETARSRGGDGGGSTKTNSQAVYDWYGSVPGLVRKVMCMAGPGT